MILVKNDRPQPARTTLVQGKIIGLVENGVDFSVWRSDSSLSKAAVRQVHFIFLGRPIDLKAVDLLLEAFPAVVAQTDAVLEIIGDGAHPRGTRSSNSSFKHRQQRCI